MPLVVIGEKRVLFVHIPKTGGTTIEKYLSSHGQLSLKSTSREEHMGCRLQHLHAEPLKQICDPQQINWSFMVIRHPVARILSEYRYRMRKGHWLRDRVSFSTWLSYSFGRYRFDSYYRDNHFRPQYEFEYPG